MTTCKAGGDIEAVYCSGTNVLNSRQVNILSNSLDETTFRIKTKKSTKLKKQGVNLFIGHLK